MVNTKMNRKDKISVALDVLDDAKDYYEENKDDIHSIFGIGDKVMEIEGREMLGEFHINNEEVVIVAEVDEVDEGSKITVERKDDRLAIIAGDQRLEEKVPDDIDMDSIETLLKNDVLTVEIKRKGD